SPTADIRQDGAHVARVLALRVEVEVAAVLLERVGLPLQALVGRAEEQVDAWGDGVERRRLLQRRERTLRLGGPRPRRAAGRQARGSPAPPAQATAASAPQRLAARGAEGGWISRGVTGKSSARDGATGAGSARGGAAGAGSAGTSAATSLGSGEIPPPLSAG